MIIMKREREPTRNSVSVQERLADQGPSCHIFNIPHTVHSRGLIATSILKDDFHVHRRGEKLLVSCPELALTCSEPYQRRQHHPPDKPAPELTFIHCIMSKRHERR